MKGEGNFNWRFVFPFEYSDIENKIIHKARPSALSLTVHEEKIPPIFHLQVWDADEITSDDYLGKLCLIYNYNVTVTRCLYPSFTVPRGGYVAYCICHKCISKIIIIDIPAQYMYTGYTVHREYFI